MVVQACQHKKDIANCSCKQPHSHSELLSMLLHNEKIKVVHAVNMNKQSHGMWCSPNIDSQRKCSQMWPMNTKIRLLHCMCWSRCVCLCVFRFMMPLTHLGPPAQPDEKLNVWAAECFWAFGHSAQASVTDCWTGGWTSSLCACVCVNLNLCECLKKCMWMFVWFFILCNTTTFCKSWLLKTVWTRHVRQFLHVCVCV